MKKFVRPLILCAGLAIILSVTSFLLVRAQDTTTITPQQIEYIRGNCISLKNTLNQTHISDALLRVNMGQRYELISTKLMNRFNARVGSNNFSNTGLISAYRNFNTELENFRIDYKSYEEKLSETINIDCVLEPTAFYEAIILVRIERFQVYSDIVKLNKYIDEYLSAVNVFENSFKTIIEGLKN